MKKVLVSADEKGNVIIPSKNPEYGSIRLEQERVVIDERGFARIKTLSTLVQGRLEDLKRIGWNAGEELEGKIIVREQLTPFNTLNPERDYKVAGETGVVCTVNGKAIFRKAFYSTSPTAADVLLSHTNVDDIKEAYLKLQAEKAEKAGAEANADLNVG